MNKFKPLLTKLDNEIDELVSKYGMTPDIESVNEDWVELMHAYYTDYRGSKDDDAVIEMATEIYKHIQQIKFFHERPLYEQFNNMSVGRHGVAATGAVIVQRHENNIVIIGSDSELEEIRDKMKRSFNVNGKIIKNPRGEKPAGLYYDQIQGRHLVTLNVTQTDYSNKALGGAVKRKRTSEIPPAEAPKKQKRRMFNYAIHDGRMYLPRVIKSELDELAIPCIAFANAVRVDLRYKDMLVERGLLANEVSLPEPKTSSSDFREFDLKTTISPDWYEFRGTDQYYGGWEHGLDNIESEKMGRYVPVTLGRICLIYIAVKRESSWTKYIRSNFNKTLDRDIYYTDEFKSRFLESPKNHDYIYLCNLRLEFSSKTIHSNSLIFWPAKKLIIRMEPHGTESGSYNVKKSDDNLELVFKHLLPNYTYCGPTSYQQKFGPQAMEQWKQTKFKTVTKKFGSKRRLQQAGGFCLAWTTYFQTMVMLNTSQDFKYIYKKALEKQPNDLATDIRLFQSWVVDNTKDKYKDKYVKNGF